MLDLDKLDVDEIAMALSDQNDFEHAWLIDPRTGELSFWTSDTGMDGSNPVDLDDLDLVPIDPLPSCWAPARRGHPRQGSLPAFKGELFGGYPYLVPVWHAFSDARAKRRAVEWLLEQDLVDDIAAQKFLRPSGSGTPLNMRETGFRRAGRSSR